MKNAGRHDLVLLLLSCAGAWSCGGFLSPKPPEVLVQEAYSKADYDSDRTAYAAAVDAGDIAKATRLRDGMLWSTIRDVNRVYFAFRSQFLEGRDWANTTMDVAKLGMSAAATVLGGSAALSAAVTALEGTSLSIDKNFFREKTTEALFTTMDALRNEQLALIQTKLIQPPPGYGFEEAFNDAVVLFNAGTVLSALERIAADAGKQAIEAKKSNADATVARVTATLSPTTADALTLKKTLSDIAADLASDPTDTAKLTSIRKILDLRGIAAPPTDTPEDLYDKLKTTLRAAQGDQHINELVAVFKAAGVWKE